MQRGQGLMTDWRTTNELEIKGKRVRERDTRGKPLHIFTAVQMSQVSTCSDTGEIGRYKWTSVPARKRVRKPSECLILAVHPPTSLEETKPSRLQPNTHPPQRRWQPLDRLKTGEPAKTDGATWICLKVKGRWCYIRPRDGWRYSDP